MRTVAPSPLYLKIILPGIIFLVCSCYTRFAEFETLPSEKVITVLDSSGNLVREIRRDDTIVTSRGETCVWEQDANGYPYLHCYERCYPLEWYGYNKSPWWYRTDEHLYNAERCPAYYYFDNTCGCCRYYLNNPAMTHKAGTSGEPRVSTASRAPAASVQTVSRLSDTNVSAAATTSYNLKIQPKRPFENPGSITTVHAVTTQGTGAVPQKSDTVHTSPGVADTGKTGTGTHDTLQQIVPATDTSVPRPERPRRTMRSR